MPRDLKEARGFSPFSPQPEFHSGSSEIILSECWGGHAWGGPYEWRALDLPPPPPSNNQSASKSKCRLSDRFPLGNILSSKKNHRCFKTLC